MEKRSTNLLKQLSGRVDSQDFSVLPPSFYSRNTLQVAYDLLGKILIVSDQGAFSGGRIAETEAYRADDPASHSSRGKTARTAPMFESPGHAYVYFVYGMYEMLNFVTEPEGEAGAVLIRALEPLYGLDHIKKRRKKALPKDWTNGPGRLARALGIKMKDNRESLQGPRLFVLDDGYRPASVHSSPRVGISQAQEIHWRFYISHHPHVSRVKENHLGIPCSLPHADIDKKS